MTSRQSILKMFYPALMKAGKLFGLRAGIRKNIDNTAPITSFYDLEVTSIGGALINFTAFKGKNVLIVNTATDCGYTNQLGDLEKLEQLYKNEMEIIAFPSNDFKEQEKLTDEEIASFCDVNYKLSFLIARKSAVVKGSQQHPVFSWLSNKEKNGWNEKDPEWNFSKYLINRKGILTHYFGPGVSPLSSEIRSQL